MTLLDASAVVAFLAGGSAAAEVRARPADRIATSDPDVLRVAAGERLDTVALPGQG